MKLLVTGTQGTGKTVLVEYATKKDRTNFFDADTIKGLSKWRAYSTGKVVGDVAAALVDDGLQGLAGHSKPSAVSLGTSTSVIPLVTVGLRCSKSSLLYQ